jgi:hypothetical protein
MPIVKCQCGANVRVPDQQDAGAPAFRCPRCREILMAAPAPQMAGVGAPDAGLAPAPGSSAAGGANCPICQTPIAAHEVSTVCPSCQQVHHKECWDEIGGCAIYGCKSAPQTATKTEAATPMSAWGDTKQCPMCGEQIKAIALKCRFCGTAFDSVDPMTVHDVRSKLEKETGAKSLRTGAIALFIFSVVGVLAPLMLIIGAIWIVMNKKKLRDAGPVYLVLSYASVALSVVYSTMILIFALTSGS